MKANLVAIVLAAVLSLGASRSVAEGNEGLRVEASRALSLAVVDLDRKNPVSDQVADAFKESLSFVLSQRTKMPSPIKPLKVDGSRAGWGLGAGAYDAAVVIGGKMPKTMVSAEFTIIRAVPESGDEKGIVTLVMRKDDPGLAKLLEASFAEAIQGPFFRKALQQYCGAPAEQPIGWKVAGSF
jgi:hypothetical protein